MSQTGLYWVLRFGRRMQTCASPPQLSAQPAGKPHRRGRVGGCPWQPVALVDDAQALVYL